MGSGASSPQTNTATSAPAAQSTTAPAAQPVVAPPKGLQCTVQESKANVLVNFVSSVKGVNPSPPGPLSPTSPSSPRSPRSPRNGNDPKFLFGDVVVEEASDNDMASRHSWDPIAFVRDDTSTLHDMPVKVDSRLLPQPKTTLTAMSTDELFSSRVPYACPVNYKFTPCGGQCGPIRSLSSSADGTQFAVAVAGNKQCFLVDGNTGKNIMSIRGHLDPVLSCAHSRDSKFLVTASADCTVILWDLNNGKKLREIPVSYQANVCAVNDDSDVIATTSTEDFVHMWEAKSCDPLINFQRHSASIFSLGFSRRGQLISSGSTNGEIFVWNHTTGDVRFLFAKHRTPVLAVSFSQDGLRLCSVDRESIRVWDLFTGHCVFCRDTKGKIIAGTEDIEEREQINHEDSIRFTSCCFVAGNLILLSTTAKQILLLEPNTGMEVLSLPTKGVVTSFSPNWAGDVIFVGDFLGNHHKLRLFYSAKDVEMFNMNSTPTPKDKGSRLEKD